MIRPNDCITVKTGGAQFVQQIEQISEALPHWAQRGEIVPRTRHIPADEGSAATFFYQSICIAANPALPASSSRTTANIIELARTANITIPDHKMRRFKGIAYVGPKAMVLWSDPDLVDR